MKIKIFLMYKYYQHRLLFLLKYTLQMIIKEFQLYKKFLRKSLQNLKDIINK